MKYYQVCVEQKYWLPMFIHSKHGNIGIILDGTQLLNSFYVIYFCI